MSDSPNQMPALTPGQVRFLAGLVGVDIGEKRAAALVPQAEPHFGLMRALDAIDAQGAEPAAEFRLDAWRRAEDA